MFLAQLPNDATSSFRRACDEEGHLYWSVDTYLSATILDTLNLANWQRSEDGSKGKRRPKPTPRPGDKAAAASKREAVGNSIDAYFRARAERLAQQEAVARQAGQAEQQPPVA